MQHYHIRTLDEAYPHTDEDASRMQRDDGVVETLVQALRRMQWLMQNHFQGLEPRGVQFARFTTGEIVPEVPFIAVVDGWPDGRTRLHRYLCFACTKRVEIKCPETT